MFFISIPFFIKPSSYREKRVKNSDKYTSKWWQKKLNCNFTKQRVACYLNILARQERIEKIYSDEHEIVKFKPAKEVTEEEIIEEILEIYSKRLIK